MSQRIVGDDAGEPGGERGSAREAPDRRERLQIGALHRVLGILAIAQYLPCGAKQPLVIAPHDEADGSGVATRDIGRKLEVGAAFVAKFGQRAHFGTAEPGDGADDRSGIREDPIFQPSVGRIGRKDAEAARAAHRNSNDLVTSLDRKTHGHDCLQFNRRLADEAAVEPTRPTGPGPSRLVQFLRGKSRRPGVATAIGRCPVAANGALGRRSLTIERDGPEPGGVRCCCPDGFQNVELLKN